MMFLALLTTQFGALLVYLAHPQQRFLATAPPWLRQAGMMVLAAGTLAWTELSGVAAGIAGSLTAMMAVWVMLPYIAWWCGKRIETNRIAQR